MTRPLLVITLLFLASCRDSPRGSDALSKVVPVASAVPRTLAEVDGIVQSQGPAMLKTFRSRMSFVRIAPQVSEQPGSFTVSAEIEYHSFLKQNPRVARLSFRLSADGLVTQCRLEDPINKAAEVSCSQLEAKLSQLFTPSFH